MSDSDKAILKAGAGMVAEGSYPSYRKEIQEVIEKAFVEGRDGDKFWFGILWTIECPSCNQQSNEMGSIRFQSRNPQDAVAYLLTQGATCMNCDQVPSHETGFHVRVFCAPLVVLREMGFASFDADHPSTGTRYSEAWNEANE
jgi:hypothetical protein